MNAWLALICCDLCDAYTSWCDCVYDMLEVFFSLITDLYDTGHADRDLHGVYNVVSRF